MINVAIAGASGYTGLELIRILVRHPEVAITALTSEQSSGKRISDIFPTLRDRCDLILENLEPSRAAARADIIFTALPHRAAMKVVPEFIGMGKKVIDLSADYRIADPDTYGAWYESHTDRENLEKSVYGLPEIRRDKIRGGSLIANPGCYPTSIILALAPLLKNGAIDMESIIADSASGVSGAGRGARTDSLYCEVNEGFKAYGAGGTHRHIPEIEQELSLMAGREVRITFTPHLVPMDRGILSTLYANPVKPLAADEIVDIYRQFYKGEPFIRVLADGALPSTAYVRGSNFCDIAPLVDRRTGRAVIISAIDNLVKGASGQAVQNMNILCGLPETVGLEGIAIFP